MRKSKALYRHYVCPFCFHKLNECTCKYLPYTLTMIDENMQYIIRTLNEKNYTTTGCCESHYNKLGTVLYVVFSYEWPELLAAVPPEGFKYNKPRRAILHDFPKNMPKEAYEAEKSALLAALTAWCDALPVREDPYLQKKIHPLATPKLPD